MDELAAPALRLSATQFSANIVAVQQQIAPSALMLVMKDDAYGHGVSWTTPLALAAGVNWFGSYDVATALEIRQVSGQEARIFAWVTSDDASVCAALEAGIDVGIGTPHYLATVIAAAERTGTRARAHLKIDSGLHRNGFLPEEWANAVEVAHSAARAGLIEIAGVWSHLAEASDAEDDEAQRVFHAASASLGRVPFQHLTASAASWTRPELRGNLCRIGAFCYGIRSAEGPDLPGIRPVATLDAAVREVTDNAVTINLGAFDGVPSSLAGVRVGTPAGARVLQHVAETTSTVQAWPGARPGQRVSVFGPGAHGESSATSLAEEIDTVGEEILTRLGARVRRVSE